jgi:hypothetical protein
MSFIRICLCVVFATIVLLLCACTSPERANAQRDTSATYPQGVVASVETIRATNGSVQKKVAFYRNDRFNVEYYFDPDISVQFDKHYVQIGKYMPIKLANENDAQSLRALSKRSLYLKSYAWHYAADAVAMLMNIWETRSGTYITGKAWSSIISEPQPDEHGRLLESSATPVSGVASVDFPDRVCGWSISAPPLEDIEYVSTGGYKMWVATVCVDLNDCSETWRLEFYIRSLSQDPDRIESVSLARAWKVCMAQ